MRQCLQCTQKKSESEFQPSRLWNKFARCRKCCKPKNGKWIQTKPIEYKCAVCGKIKICKTNARHRIRLCGSKICHTIYSNHRLRKADLRIIYKAWKNTTYCQICKIKFSAEKWSRYRKTIDHSHKNGSFRGIICNQCNSILGLLNDSIKILRRMSTYLKRKN